MPRMFVVAVLFALGAAAQQLTVIPSGIQGVELVGPQSHDFDALVTQIVGTDPAGWTRGGFAVRRGDQEQDTAGHRTIDMVWTKADQILLNAADGCSSVRVRMRFSNSVICWWRERMR